ncbi:hypothetical protein V8F20_009399 [Naviculisporaceae sp. PSN 640]
MPEVKTKSHPKQQAGRMARTKKTGRENDSVMTWTRFKLPASQKWPVWSSPVFGPALASQMYIGFLAENADGISRPSVGRMVDDPEQAVYLII